MIIITVIVMVEDDHGTVAFRKLISVRFDSNRR